MTTAQPFDDVTPSEVRLRADLAGEAFLGGARTGRWRIPILEWPYLIIDIAVGDGECVSMRIQVDHYPVRAPQGQLWDPELAAPLGPNRWPRGGNAERVFRTDWSPGNQNAPYLPCDRIGLSTHTNWATDYPERSWNASRTIDFYLAEIAYELTDAHLPNQEAA